MYIHRKKWIYKQNDFFPFPFVVLYTLPLTQYFLPFTLQGLSLSPKATCWVFLSRKSPCWAWCQTPQRCSAPCRAACPCWAPLPSTRLPWPRSRDACHPPSASMHRYWEAFYAGQSSDSLNMTVGFDHNFLVSVCESLRYNTRDTAALSHPQIRESNLNIFHLSKK